MKRKKYVKPHFEVYEFKQQPQLLAGSVAETGTLTDPTDYTGGDDPFNY